MTNLQNYFHPSYLNQLIYGHVQCQEPKNRQQSVPILKKTTVQDFAPLEVITLCPPAILSRFSSSASNWFWMSVIWASSMARLSRLYLGWLVVFCRLITGELVITQGEHTIIHLYSSA